MMPLEQIRRAEREFWQQAFCAATSSDNHDLESKCLEHMIPHYSITADHAVEEWRKRFAPHRVGMAIESDLA